MWNVWYRYDGRVYRLLATTEQVTDWVENDNGRIIVIRPLRGLRPDPNSDRLTP